MPVPPPAAAATARAATQRLQPRVLRLAFVAVVLKTVLLVAPSSFMTVKTQSRNGAAGKRGPSGGMTGGGFGGGGKVRTATVDVGIRRPRSQDSKKHRPGTWRCGCDACISFDSADEVKAAELDRRETLEQHYKKYHDMFVALPSIIFPERALRMRQSLACSACGTSGDEDPGEAVWAAGVALATYISQATPPGRHGNEKMAPWHGVDVLELGSGTGVAGLAAAAEGANVLLTDRDNLMPLMAKNIRLNQDYMELGSADCEAFDWTAPPPKEVSSAAWDVVLCSESVTESDDVPLFADTLASLLGPDGAAAGATAI